MKLKSQLTISIAILGAIFLIIFGSYIITNQQVNQLNSQEQIARNIQTGASDLSYLSNDFFLYQQSSQATLFHTKISSLTNDLSTLNPANPAQATLINNTKNDLKRLDSVFGDAVSFLENSPRNMSVRVLPAFQTAWSRLAVQSETLTHDSAQLSQILRDQSDQLKQTNSLLVFAMVGAFAIYFVTIYFLVFKRTFKSITKLQDGTKIIGSGNLDYSIAARSNDEVGELSRAFNQMTANLKTVTASKTDLEQAQASLRESEQRWATTLASIGDAVIATDTSGKIVFMNGEAEELTGWSLSEASAKPIKEVFNIVNEETRLEVENPIDKVLREGMVVGLANHTVLIKKDGSIVPIDDSGAPIKDKEGKITGVVLIFRDITERKKAEEQLRFQAGLLGNVYDALVATDENFVITYWSKTAENTFGWTAQEAIGKLLRDLLQTNVPTSSTIESREKMLKNNYYEGEVYYCHKNGVYLITETRTTTIRGSKGELKSTLSVLHDITERKKAEEELVTTKDRLAEELAGSLRLQKLGMIFVSQDNLQALLNEIVFAAIEIMHADMGNMQQITKNGELKIVAQSGFKQPFLDFFNCVSDDSHAACAAAMASKERVIIRDVTQSPIFLNTPSLDVLLEAGVRAVVSTPFFTRSGEFLGIISTHFRSARKPDEFDLRLLDLLVRQAADLVERTQTGQKLEDYAKNLEKLVDERTKQLKDAERLAAIGATAGMVGHDIRNPLQAITGDVYLVKTELDTIPEGEEKKNIQESLTEIEKNIDYINKIVADLQDFARPLKPNAEETDLKRVIDELLQKNGLPENVKVSVKVETGKVVADSTYINRIMFNLVNNAVQAMPKGGKLTIRTYKDANDTVISVKDTGVGIPEAVKGKLFTPMFTTKSKGQGFGLAVIKRMTEALGGTVSFESQEGKGTTFIIRLPPPKELKGKWTYK